MFSTYWSVASFAGAFAVSGGILYLTYHTALETYRAGYAATVHLQWIVEKRKDRDTWKNPGVKEFIKAWLNLFWGEFFSFYTSKSVDGKIFMYKPWQEPEWEEE